MLRHVKTSADWRFTPLKTQMTMTNWKSSPVWRGDTSGKSLKKMVVFFIVQCWFWRGFLSWIPSSTGERCTVRLTNDRHQGQQNKFGPGSFCSNAPAPGDICGVATVQMTDISPREVQGAKHTAGQNDGHSSC